MSDTVRWWVAALLVLLVVLVAADRWVAHRTPSARVRPVRRAGGGAGAFGELFALYQPTVRHLHEEEQRQRHDLVLPGDADPPWDVDLDAGTAHAHDSRARPSGRAASTPPPVGARASRHLVAVAPGVWTTTAGRWATVTTVVVADDGTCLVVDPGLTVAEVEDLAAELRARGWTPVAGFSTHPHWDHVLWSASLGDVPRWATPDGARAARTHRHELVRDADAEAPGHDHTCTGRLTPLPAGATTVPWAGPRAVVVPYRGHCHGSAALLLVDTGVLVAGDVLSDVEVPLLDLRAPDPLGDYRETLAVLEDVAHHGVRVLVPGHGTLGDAAELARRLAADRAYLDGLPRGDAATDLRLDAPEMAAQHAAQVRRLAP